MKISVIMSVYNGEAYLRTCLESITGNPETDMEIIIVNDGSEDNSQKIIEEFAGRDCRIRSVFQKNAGVSGARNTGLKLASGRFIYFSDCDDIVYPDTLWAMYETACEQDADLVIGNYRYLHDYSGELEIPSQWLDKGLFTEKEKLWCTHLSCILPNKLWKRELIEKYCLEFYPLQMGEDLSFFLRYLAVSRRIATVKDCVYDYRFHEGSASYSYSLKDLDYIEAFDLVEQFYESLGGMEEFIRELKYDRLFYYVRCLKRLPRFGDKSIRRKLSEEYIRAEEALDYSDVRDRKDIMELAGQFKKRKQLGLLYESDIYAFCYQMGRRLKHLYKKLIFRRKGGSH